MSKKSKTVAIDDDGQCAYERVQDFVATSRDDPRDTGRRGGTQP
jgi:hypothetical protein